MTYIPSLLFLSFQITDIRKISVLLIVIQAIADNEQVINLKTYIICFYIRNPPGRFIQQRAYPNTFRISIHQIIF